MFNPLKFLSNIVKNSNQRELDRIEKTLSLVNSFESKMKELKDEGIDTAVIPWINDKEN